MKDRSFLAGKWLVRCLVWLTVISFCLPGVSKAAGDGQRFEEPTIKVYEYYESDEPVEISSTWPEDADSLAIYIHDDQGRDAIPGCMWNQKNKGWTYYTFEVNVQDRLLEPGSYTAIIELRGNGYRTSRFERPFLILPAGMTLDEYEAQQGFAAGSEQTADVPAPDPTESVPADTPVPASTEPAATETPVPTPTEPVTTETPVLPPTEAVATETPVPESEEPVVSDTPAPAAADTSLSLPELVRQKLATAGDDELEEAGQLIRTEQRARLKTKIVLDPEEAVVAKGQSLKISAEITELPEGVKGGKFAWSTSDTKTATCLNGTIKGLNAGKAIVSCSTTLSDGTELVTDCEVTVITPVNNIRVGKNKISIAVSETFRPEYEVLPQDATNREVEITSSDETIVKADDQGNLTAVAAGRAEVTIAAKDGSGKKGKISVEVTPKIGKAEGQITFQGIPWRSSVEEVERLLTESGLVKEGAITATSVYTPFNLVPGTYLQKDEGRLVIIPQTMDHHGYIRNCQVLMLWSSDVEKTIGGYKADSIYFTFAYDGENTELTTVKLVLKTDDEERAIKDLQEKLTGIYGKNQRGSYKSYYALVWKGAENTAALIFSDSKYGEAVSLYYGMISPSAVYDAADKRLTSQPGQVDTGDANGL